MSRTFITAAVVIAILLHALITLRGRTQWRHFLALNALIAPQITLCPSVPPP